MKVVKCSYGVSSQCDHRAEHIFMIDYDGVSLENVREHLKYIQKELGLSTIFIIKSKHGYNALSLDKLPISLIYSYGTNILSPADRDFFKYGYGRNYYVLRFDQDKEIVEILPSDSKKYKKSEAHRIFMEFFFGLNIDYDNSFDDNQNIIFVQYPSNKNGYHDQEKLNYVEDLKSWM